MSSAPLQGKPAQFREGLDGCLSAVPTDAAIFHAAKRNMRLVIHRAVINVGHARLQTMGKGQAFFLIAGDDAS